jgi:GNAT superfamily N-acetyltransferase
MSKVTDSPDFHIRPISPAEWRASAVGGLALPPDFWEDGPGTTLEEDRVTTLAAFLGKQMLGYIGVREIPRVVLSSQLETGLKELLAKHRQQGRIGATALATVERPAVTDEEVIGYNFAYALALTRGQGVGTALTAAALARADQSASAEQPMPAYVSVARPNPAMSLYRRMGFEPMTVNGQPFIRTDPYYLPPSPEGTFAHPTDEESILMGTVLTGDLPVS